MTTRCGYYAIVVALFLPLPNTMLLCVYHPNIHPPCLPVCEDYFLEDCIKMLNYVPPPPDERKRKRRQDMLLPSATDQEDNCNLRCDPEYGESVARSMREIVEKETPFDLVGCLLEHIANMGIPGAVLIFLPGWNIISLLRKYLQMHPRFGSTAYLILPLHSQVPREDQRLVFRASPPGVTKIVLSTNIAETSITINDVVFVIDFCLVRMKLFTARNNLTSYSTSWASKTNLEQRRGRAGRVRAGYAFHLCRYVRTVLLPLLVVIGAVVLHDDDDGECESLPHTSFAITLWFTFHTAGAATMFVHRLTYGV